MTTPQTQTQTPCRCAKAACDTAGRPPERCICGEQCACKGGCSCGESCRCQGRA